MNYLFVTLIVSIPIHILVHVLRKTKNKKKNMLFLAFLVGCFSPVIIVFYQKFWGQTMNLIFFEFKAVDFTQSLSQFSSASIMQKLLVFVFGVGMMEEFLKHFMIRKDKPAGFIILLILLLFFQTGFTAYKLIIGSTTFFWISTLIASWLTFYLFITFHKHLNLKSINDVIQISIMSAIGFAFSENISYLYSIIQASMLNQSGILKIFIVRSSFIIMVHLLCSSVFGYYYGLSLFAGPYLKKYYNDKTSILVKFLRKILRFSKDAIFKEEKLLEGLIIAMVLHGLYDFILEVDLNFGELLNLVSISSNSTIPLYPFIMVLYFIGGIRLIRHLLNEKKNHLKFGLVGTEAMPIKDFENIIDNIENIKYNNTVDAKLIKEKWASEEELRKLKNQVAYIEKFKLLEKKYVKDKNWISKDLLKNFHNEVENIKLKQPKKSRQDN